jgi:hypothetical protein
MFLSSVLGLPGDGTSTGGRSQHCGVEHDPRSRRLRSSAKPRGMGKLARNYRPAAGDRNRWRVSSSGVCWVLRVLIVGGLDEASGARWFGIVGGRATCRFVETSHPGLEGNRETAGWIPRHAAAHAGRRRVPHDGPICWPCLSARR